MSARRQARRRAEREREREQFERLWENPEMTKWLDDVIDGMAPKIAGSRFTLSIAPGMDKSEPDRGDAKYWVELGATIMMDKPLIVIARERMSLPQKLRMVADEIVRIPDGPLGPEARRMVSGAITRMHERLGL